MGFLLESSQFEVYEKFSIIERFIGNAFAATFPDGSTRIVTASHVAFNGWVQRDLVLRRPSERKCIGDLKFYKRFEVDCAFTDPLSEPGIEVAETPEINGNLYISGTTNGGKRHKILVAITYIGGLIPSEFLKRGVQLDGQRVHYSGSDDKQSTFPGTSGSVILDASQRALAVHAINHNEVNYHGHGIILMTKGG